MKKIAKIPDLVATVKDALFEAILTGDLRPGEKLQQAKLAETLGVSRQPVSHALRLLVDQGILTALDARSLTVANPDIHSMLQMMDVRSELDGLAARLAARNFANGTTSKKDLDIVAEIEALVAFHAAHDTASAKQTVTDDIRFHELIRELSGNDFIQESLARFVLHHNRLIYLMARDMDQKIWPEHRDILNAITSGDETKAVNLMRGHIARGTEKLETLSETSVEK